MVKMKRRSGLAMGVVHAATILVLLGFLTAAPSAARAQNQLQPTQILVGAPAQASLGDSITVQAMLTDSQGNPIPKALIYFTTQETFLHSNSDVVLTQALTNADGQAVAQIKDDFSAKVTLQAEFRGDAQYAPSNASTDVATTGGQQVYAEHVGVDVPGLNVPPMGAPRAAVSTSQGGIMGMIASLWPAMNGWPVAAILLLVWSMYLLAVRFVFRLAALGDDRSDLPEFDSRRRA